MVLRHAEPAGRSHFPVELSGPLPYDLDVASASDDGAIVELPRVRVAKLCCNDLLFPSPKELLLRTLEAWFGFHTSHRFPRHFFAPCLYEGSGVSERNGDVPLHKAFCGLVCPSVDFVTFSDATVAENVLYRDRIFAANLKQKLPYLFQLGVDLVNRPRR